MNDSNPEPGSDTDLAAILEGETQVDINKQILVLIQNDEVRDALARALTEEGSLSTYHATLKLALLGELNKYDRQ